jgi:hypothetical protein
VPSPVSPDSGSTSLPIIDVCNPVEERRGSETRRRARSRQRTANSVNLSTSRDYGYDSESQGYDSLPYEPPPDYDLEDNTTTRRWSVVGSILHKNNHDNKPKNLIKLENVNIKIPKTKLNHKHFERARSHSPNKNKYQTKPIKSEPATKNFNSKVVTSKSHYELMSGKQRPEVGQNGECERMSSEHKQVRNSCCLFCNYARDCDRTGSKSWRKSRRKKRASFALCPEEAAARSPSDRWSSRKDPDTRLSASAL